MDLAALPLIIGAVFTGVSGIIIALATLRKAMGTTTRAHQALARLWDWIVDHDLDDQVPRGLRRTVEEILNEEADEDDLPSGTMNPAESPADEEES